MAVKYWVGGSGTWDTANTANWSFSSGGSGGASIPAFGSDDVVFDANSGTGTCTIASNYSPSVINFTVTSGCNITFSSVNRLNINNTANVQGGNLSNLSLSISQLYGAAPGSFTHTLNGNIKSVTISNVTFPSGIPQTNDQTINGNATCTDGWSISCYSGNSMTINVSSTNQEYYISSHGQPATLTIPSTWRARSIASSSGTFSFNPTALSTTELTLVSNSGASLSSTLPSSNLTFTDRFRVLGGFVSTNNNLTINAPTVVLGGASGSSPGTVVLTNSNCNLQISRAVSSVSYSAPGPSNRFLTVNANSGSIGTLTINGSGQGGFPGLTLNSDLVTTNLVLIGNSTSSKVQVIGSPVGTQRKLQATSFSLSNVYWKDIDADGTVPFTGSGFEDGGNNLDIIFVLPQYAGLFFGSNF